MLAEQTPLSSGAGSINLPPRFDFVKSAEYRMPFARLLVDPNHDSIKIDCSGVTYVDSCGIGTLIAWHRACEKQGKTMVIEHCGKNVMQIFKMLSVDMLFHIA